MEERIALLEAEVARRTRAARHGRHRRRWWRAPLMLLCAALLAAVPLGVLGANFGDLNPDSPHNGNINAIADAGISRGCGGTEHYCPNNLVTREEMASFLARTAGLGDNSPVANALTAVTATNAATVGGYAPSGLVRVAHAERASQLRLTKAFQVYLTVTIEAPAPGFVVLTGNVNFRSDVSVTGGPTANDEEYALMYADLRHQQSGTTNNATASVAMLRLRIGAWEAIPLNHTFPVQAGVQVFEVRVIIYADTDIATSFACPAGGSSCSVTARSAEIDALFVPFGYDGGTALAP
jgi:hypothetical protein